MEIQIFAHFLIKWKLIIEICINPKFRGNEYENLRGTKKMFLNFLVIFIRLIQSIEEGPGEKCPSCPSSALSHVSATL